MCSSPQVESVEGFRPVSQAEVGSVDSAVNNSAIPVQPARRSSRVPGGEPLENPNLVRFLDRLKNNCEDSISCEGRILRLKRHIPPGSKPNVINLVLDALAVNTRVEVLYIQNFEPGFLDEQLDRLTEVLKLRRIWGLNVGENFGVSMPAWERFTENLKFTAVTHMYASEHHFRNTDIKIRMRDAIRANRGKMLTPKPHSIEAIMECGNMWYNPKLPKWATRQMEKNSQAALFASQQMASHMESGYCQPPPGAQPAPSQATKQVAAVSREVAKEHRMLARTPGKRVVIRTEKATELKDEADARERRMVWANILARREKRRRSVDGSPMHGSQPSSPAVIKNSPTATSIIPTKKRRTSLHLGSPSNKKSLNQTRCPDVTASPSPAHSIPRRRTPSSSIEKTFALERTSLKSNTPRTQPPQAKGHLTPASSSQASDSKRPLLRRATAVPERLRDTDYSKPRIVSKDTGRPTGEDRMLHASAVPLVKRSHSVHQERSSGKRNIKVSPAVAEW
eukprot:CAMPEP_0114225824 /NCGR_PEP_ID=MMETSP0058-20121206/889_1 /TAXON_ID=36894 /ORGANISM="Pyramimonas parkeae, CCMP726" /LENGTH=508 /DNA_ID=CAMNT_0001336477 /DNA_START=57 /DNA_END=1580 /DNA_ORIENTATION=-